MGLTAERILRSCNASQVAQQGVANRSSNLRHLGLVRTTALPHLHGCRNPGTSLRRCTTDNTKRCRTFLFLILDSRHPGDQQLGDSRERTAKAVVNRRATGRGWVGLALERRLLHHRTSWC